MNLTSIRSGMLNRRAKKNSSQIIKRLELKKGNVISDIGSGGGYFTFEFSKIVSSDGKVFAVDTNQKLLAHINKISKRDHIDNIETVISNENCCLLPTTICDFIFMRNVFHHITNPVSYFKDIKSCIRTGGKIVIIEWIPNINWNFISYTDHCTQYKEIQKIMREAGFTHVKSFDFLKAQSFNIFQK
ncbi:methyltransferase domain-containing protein [Clostridium estertheticum]|uniref:Methyltransferase domain-containing protein n=1 Tax=Clostridium estertheticum TaxID=238834 RepID=A0A5N7IUV5_9CLOT|nr:methyltransferase domain-containing protein [Clostridium estertheticum]MPQ34071.1 methyltransferase domain-containing protein [Clostridium estertheticum]MPQ64872.1 methyltransferase domain-containing protein [Clostridium estertheticum]